MTRRRELEDFVDRVQGLPAHSQLESAAVELLEALDQDGIEALLLKGPVLARVLYEPHEHRGYSDIDVLVPADRVDAARTVLANEGYTPAQQALGIDDIGGVVHAEAWQLTADIPGAEVILADLHWRLTGWDAPPGVTWAALQADSERMELNGREVFVPARHALALHLATHAAQHGLRGEKALADLQLGLDRWPNDVWRRAADLAQTVGAVTAMAAGLHLTARGEEMARRLDLPKSEHLTWSILNRDARPRGTFHVRAFAEAPNLRTRMSVLRRSLFPTRVWIRWQYPWAERGSVALVAGYAAHLARSPALAARAWAYRRRERRAAR